MKTPATFKIPSGMGGIFRVSIDAVLTTPMLRVVVNMGNDEWDGQRYDIDAINLEPIDPDAPTIRQMIEEAARIADRHDVTMAVGLQQNDKTGEPEFGYCPLDCVGPATVYYVVRYVAPNEQRAGDRWCYDCNHAVCQCGLK